MSTSNTELTRVVLHGEEIAFAQEMARIAHEAGIIPPNTKPATISAIILAGKEMGLQPFHALRSLYFVQGRLLMSVQAQLALHTQGYLSREIPPNSAEIPPKNRCRT